MITLSADRAGLLAGVGLLLTFVVIGLGAWTRLVDAGLGCPDWPTCYGFMVLPQTAQEVAQADARYPLMPYRADIAIPEVVHRFAAGLLGVLVLAMVLLRLWGYRRGARPLPRAELVLLGLIVAQGLFGYLTVSMRLWPPVVTLHLLGGMATLALLWRLVPVSLPVHRTTPVRWRFAWVCLGLLVVQMALGGWVSANYAGLACPDFPTCQGQWWPPTNFSEGFDLWRAESASYLGGVLDSDARIGIHVAHRLGAVAVAVAIGLLAWQLWQAAAPRWMPLALCSALVVQLGIGIVSVLALLPLWLALAHNLGAAVLLLVLVAVLQHHRSC